MCMGRLSRAWHPGRINVSLELASPGDAGRGDHVVASSLGQAV